MAKIVAAISAKNKKKTVAVSDTAVWNDKFNGKQKNENSLLKLKCKGEKIIFVDNSNITASLLNYSGLHLNECGK